MNLAATGYDCTALYEQDKAMRAEDAAQRAAKKAVAGFDGAELQSQPQPDFTTLD